MMQSSLRHDGPRPWVYHLRTLRFGGSIRPKLRPEFVGCGFGLGHVGSWLNRFIGRATVATPLLAQPHHEIERLISGVLVSGWVMRA